MDMTTHANPCGAATTWVVWANTRHVTCIGLLGPVFCTTTFFINVNGRLTSIH